MTQHALESLNRSKLVRFAAGLVGDDAAEDVVQDVYLKLLQPHATFRDEAALETWVMACVRNTAIDHLRKNDPIDGGSIEDVNDATTVTSPDYDEAIDLRRAIDRLPPQLAETARAYMAHDSRESAAASLGLKVPGYATRLSKALRALRQSLGVNAL
jgi:RNA polymerase sigma factor (sigma-70 family)